MPFAFLASACSSNPGSTGSNGPFVYLGSNEAYLVQWVDNGGVLSGSVEEAEIPAGSSSSSLTTQSITLKGRIEGSKISISFNNRPDVLGTISRDGFTLQLPSSTGSLSPFTFRSGAISQFNNAVSRLHVLAAADAAANNVLSDESTVKSADTSSSIFQDMASQISSLDDEDAPSQYACETAADYLANNLGSAESGPLVSNFMMDISNIMTIEMTETGDVSSLKNDVQTYLSTEKTLGSPPPNAPDLTAISQLESSAQADAVNLLSRTNQLIDQWNGTATRLYQQVEGLNQADSCGFVPTVPTQIQHIS